jgi:hypothetical protein
MMESLYMLILFCGMFAIMASGGAPDSIDLSAYQWKNRLLFLFATPEEDPSYFSLKKEIEHQATEVLDRDLLIAHVFEKGQLRDPHGIRRIARSAPPCGRRSACVFPLARSLSLRSLTLAHQLTPLHLTTLLLDGPLRRPLRRYTAHAGGSATPVATAP